MPEIILTAEQAQLVTETDRVRVVGPNGDILGHIERLGLSADDDRLGWSADELSAIRRRGREGRTWYSGEQVQSHLLALERALELEGSIEEDHARQVLNEARARFES